MRHTCLLASLASLVTLAACGGSQHPAGSTGGGAAIAIDLGPPDEEFGVAGFDDHGALPAISSDGTLVAALFHDTVDFVGLPVDTIVVWRTADGTRVGEVSSNDGEAPNDDGAPVADPGRAAAATKLLAGHRWVKVAATPTVAPADQGEGVETALADGRVLRFAEATFVLDGGEVTPSAFPAPGSGSDEIGGGGCGEIGGFAVLATGADWLLVAPTQINLGGDSCFGAREAGLAQVVRVGR